MFIWYTTIVWTRVKKQDNTGNMGSAHQMLFLLPLGLLGLQFLDRWLLILFFEVNT